MVTGDATTVTSTLRVAGQITTTGSKTTSTKTTSTTSKTTSSTSTNPLGAGAGGNGNGKTAITSSSSTSTNPAGAAAIQTDSNGNPITVEHHGLSAGAKAGVGVGVALAILALIGALLFLPKKILQKKRNEVFEQEAVVGDGNPPVGGYYVNGNGVKGPEMGFASIAAAPSGYPAAGNRSAAYPNGASGYGNGSAALGAKLAGAGLGAGLGAHTLTSNPSDNKHRRHRRRNGEETHHHHIGAEKPCSGLVRPSFARGHVCPPETENGGCYCSDKKCPLNEMWHDCAGADGDEEVGCDCIDGECEETKREDKRKRMTFARGGAKFGFREGGQVM